MNIVGGIETDAPVDVRVQLSGLSVPCPLRYDGKDLAGRHRWRAFAPITEPEIRGKEFVVTLAKPPADGHDLIVELSQGGHTVGQAPWNRFPVEGCLACLHLTHQCRTCTEFVDHDDDLCSRCAEDEDKEETA